MHVETVNIANVCQFVKLSNKYSGEMFKELSSPWRYRNFDFV